MKKQIIKYSAILFFLTAAFAFIAFKQQPPTTSNILLVTALFSNNDPGIIITDENNNQKVIELEKHGIMGISKVSTAKEYVLELEKQLNLIKGKGYKLIGCSGGDMISNYIFEKE